ncbi:chromosome partitioning protein ParA [Deinococcus seoulensis]|uniref:Chromosome partitioning protein ParA n=1 Tax=Deinococcus seoulensis TaxID=1837379 RepID=A0ABQ2RW58_9DEIO|nr:ParA family protein [Deinococcus seoulensis]GGR67373.1 chromosome partitioning protein ParA [Deinococcus seoulensis]
MTAKPHVVAFTSLKGGVGKSTLAVNIAGALSLKGKTALIDADAAIQTSSGWATRGKLPITVLKEGEAIPTGIRYLVVDTEGRPALEDIAALTHSADVVLIPTAPNSVEVEATARLLQQLPATNANLDRVYIVITKAQPVGTIGQSARDELRSVGLQVCETVIRRYTAHERAHEQGVLVKDAADPRSENAWADVLGLTLEVC